MDRIEQGTAASISITFTVDGVATDPSPATATIEVVRDDGTNVVTAGTATSHTGTGEFTFTLTPTHTASLDVLTARWTTTLQGFAQTLETEIEVVGGFLFGLGELSPLVPNTVTDNQLTRARTRVEQAIERRVGFAFVPRYGRATLNGGGLTLLMLPAYLRRVRWASTTTAGTTTSLAPADIANLSVSQAGFVTGYCWPRGYGNVTVGYEHGLNGPDEEIRAAALDWARFSLTQDSTIDSRAERLITDDGTLVFSGGSGSGLPSVDRVIDTYRLPAIA